MATAEELIDDVAAAVGDLGIGVEISADTLSDLSDKGDVRSCLNALAAEIARAAPRLGIALPAVPGIASPLSAFVSFASSLGHSYSVSHSKDEDMAGAGAGSGHTPALDAHTVLLTLFALATELQGMRMALAHVSKEAAVAKATAVEPGPESELYLLCRALSIPPGSDDSLKHTPQRALAQVKARLDKVLTKLPQGFFTSTGPLLDVSSSTPEVLAALTDLNGILRSDYGMRREMLLARLDLTLQAFLWSRKAEGREGEIMSSIAHRRRALTIAPAPIRPEDAFLAGPELAALHARRVTDASSRGLRSASVKSVRIGAVPDRGGRVSEMAPSARDLMPAWQARKSDAPTHFGGGGGGGGGRGGRGGGGGGGSKSYSKDHESRAVQLLQEASKYEGEAGAALEERLGEADDGDDHMESGEGGGHAGGGRGKGRGGGGRGRGGRHGGGNAGAGAGAGPSVTVTLSGPPPGGASSSPGAGSGSGNGSQPQTWRGGKRGRDKP